MAAARLSRWPLFAVAGVILGGIFVSTHREMIAEPPSTAREACDSLVDRSLCQAASMVSQRSAGIVSSVLVTDTLPNAQTPGALNPAITQANISDTICNPAFLAAQQVRPSWAAGTVRRLVKRDYPNPPPQSFHLDQLVPISLGGAAGDGRNLWLQSWTGQNNARSKDSLERVLNHMVCAGQVPLASAQKAIARNWIDLKTRVMAISLPPEHGSQMAQFMPQDQSPAALQAVMIANEPQGQHERDATSQPSNGDVQELAQEQPHYEVPAIVPDQF